MPLVHRCPHCNGRDVRSALWVDPNATNTDIAANIRFDVVAMAEPRIASHYYCRTCNKRLTSLVAKEEQATFSVSVQVSYDIVVDIQADSMEQAKARAKTLRIAHPRKDEAVWPYPDGAQSFVVAAFEGDAGKLSEPQMIEYSDLTINPWRHQIQDATANS